MELKKKKKRLLQFGVVLYDNIFHHKLEQLLITNWGSFVVLQIWVGVITNRGSLVITNLLKQTISLQIF